jgi:dUTP pyrophosphatase
MEEIKTLKFVNKSPNPDPVFKCDGDSGFDLRAWVEDGDEIVLHPLERKLIHTGLYFEIPQYTEIQVRPRSGLALKNGISLVNTPGTVDESYTGEVSAILINLSNEDFVIHTGDRIAQAVLMPVFNKALVEFKKIDEITSDTERGAGGFGHTGVS